MVCDLQLLGELLLDRHNFQTMTRYISSPDNLKLMMIMLREKSRNIQFEAFHVFKVRMALKWFLCRSGFLGKVWNLIQLFQVEKVMVISKMSEKSGKSEVWGLFTVLIFGCSQTENCRPWLHIMTCCKQIVCKNV